MNTFHQDVWEMEKAWESQGAQPWDSYVDKIVRLMGVENEDGDEATDGYSIDSMGDAFDAGIVAEDYAKGVRAPAKSMFHNR